MDKETNLKLLAEFAPHAIVDPAPGTVLKGHVSAETAVYVSSYPYGRLRSTMAYWLERNGKKGVRMVSRTNDPKLPGLCWNAPKPSIYSDGIIVLVVAENGHIERRDLTMYSAFDNGEPEIDAFVAAYGAGFTEYDENRVKVFRRAAEMYAKKKAERDAAPAAREEGS